MSRTATPVPASKEVEVEIGAIESTLDAANQLATLTSMANDAAHAMAVQIGYQGAMTVGALEDEIRFYQRRTVEAILETGKRLLVLKELTAHGEFTQRVEMLGFHKLTAQRFMRAAVKTSKSVNLTLLSTQVKSASAFLELVTHDDDVLENLAEMDDVEKMSASQLRAALRESREEKNAVEKVLSDKNTANDKLRAQLKRIDTLPANEALQSTLKEATAVMHDAAGAISGGVRQALIALNDVPEGTPNQAVFMAGLLGQLQAELNALRDEFNLPDVSNANDQRLAAEMAEWDKE